MMLLRCQPGAFIVLFTESEPGGVSIAMSEDCHVRVCLCAPVYVMCVHTRAEMDSNFYYPDIPNRIFPDILRIVTSSIAIETLYVLS